MQNASMIPDIMNELNKAFAPAGIQFYTSCVEIDTIANDAIYNCNLTSKININGYGINEYLSNIISIPNSINIYYVNSIIDLAGEGAGGFATFPWHPDNYDYIIVLKNQTIRNFPNSFNYLKNLVLHIHEMGHYFGLLHTFEGYNSSSRAEHPTDRRNCSRSGDELCDTPADVNDNDALVRRAYHEYYDIYPNPEIPHCVICLCSLNQSSFFINAFPHNAPNGWNYSPNIGNYMAYTPEVCRDHFTPGQNTRMQTMINNHTKLSSKQWTAPNILIRIGMFYDDPLDMLYDTLFHHCGDTIFYHMKNGTEKCINKGDSVRIYFPHYFHGNPFWVINGDTVFQGIHMDTLNQQILALYFRLTDYAHLWAGNYDNDYIIVEAITGNTKYTFKFKVSSNQEVADAFANFWKNSGYEIEGNTATIGVDLLDGGSIRLPNMEDCILITENFPEGVSIVGNDLVIDATEECEIPPISLRYECECVGTFNINIRNTGVLSLAKENFKYFGYDIDGITDIFFGSDSFSIQISLPDVPCELILAEGWVLDNNVLIVPVVTGGDCNVTIPLVYDCDCIGTINISIRDMFCDPDSCNFIDWSAVVIDVDTCGNTKWIVSATLTDTTKKITKMEYFHYLDPDWSTNNYVYPGGVSVAVGEVNIGCYRPSDYVRDPIWCEDCYFICITFEDAEENEGQCCKLYRLPASKLCECGRIFDEIVILPIPCCFLDSHLEVAFLLSQPLTSLLTISIVNQLGILQLSFYEGIPTSLQNNIQVDIGSLPAGVYYVKFQTNDEIFSIPIIKK